MTTLRDVQLGELTLKNGRFCTTFEHGGRTIRFAIDIDDPTALPESLNLLPVKLEDMLAGALARVQAEDEHWVGEYIEHHLDQLEPDAWKAVLPEGAEPTVPSVRERLILRRIWGSYDEDGLSLTLDHGLPAELTDYVIAVRIDASGEIDDVAMES